MRVHVFYALSKEPNPWLSAFKEGYACRRCGLVFNVEAEHLRRLTVHEALCPDYGHRLGFLGTVWALIRWRVNCLEETR